ncbi:YHYH domain-containing protein [Aromatoleum toluclasticum]|uniref:YHYH domain-containing protein n=1 Tax=Aromatoleum toluclasticum TaxID=92003 RepID=UPI002B1CCA1D|nr:YHYH domain-containing protein [Aromatoleum toluclasticum]MCC4116356.1 YHYH domain-containing protein [Aromatoleum toluclasticum]
MSPSILAVAILTVIPCATALAHGGGLNADGCHNNRKTGDYHCHRGGAGAVQAPQRLVQPAAPPAGTPYRTTPPATISLPAGCYVGPRGGTYTITKSGRKNYSGC